MAPRRPKTFLLRIDAETFAALQKLANDELRSLNGEIEWLLRDALKKRGRVSPASRESLP